MKNLYILLILPLFILGCKDSNTTERTNMPATSGNINNIQVVIDDDLWQGYIGETIRNHFAAIILELPQDEPVFTINQLPPNSFSGFMQKHRNFIYIKKGEPQQYFHREDLYGAPQNGFFFTGTTNEEIVALIQEHAQTTINTIQTTEIKEQQRRMARSKFNTNEIKERFKIDFIMPSAYRTAMMHDDFVWLRKDLRAGDLNLLIYEMPLDYFEKDSMPISKIIHMRDSIGQTHLRGSVEDSYMITETAFTPHFYETEVNGKPAMLTKGTWELHNFFMAGPFENYIIRDEKNNRNIVVEGFTFSPSTGKRDHQFELRSIIHSVVIP